MSDTDERFEEYVGRIIRTYNAATETQFERGLRWYRTAYELAEMISDGNPIAGAGVIAALSPQKAWYLNKRLAENAFETGEARGHVRDAVGKAQRIMEGEDPLTVLPEDSKTWNFYRCIIDPTDPDPVCIDRHAYDVAAGEINGNRKRAIGKREYAFLAHCYREAARRLGEVPSTVQAVTWVVQVDSVAHLPHRPKQ